MAVHSENYTFDTGSKSVREVFRGTYDVSWALVHVMPTSECAMD